MCCAFLQAADLTVRPKTCSVSRKRRKRFRTRARLKGLTYCTPEQPLTALECAELEEYAQRKEKMLQLRKQKEEEVFQQKQAGT